MFALIEAELCGLALPMFQEFVDGQADVLENLAEQNRRDISPGMNGYGGAATVRVSELFVGTALTNLDKTEVFED